MIYQRRRINEDSRKSTKDDRRTPAGSYATEKWEKKMNKTMKIMRMNDQTRRGNEMMISKKIMKKVSELTEIFAKQDKELYQAREKLAESEYDYTENSTTPMATNASNRLT